MTWNVVSHNIAAITGCVEKAVFSVEWEQPVNKTEQRNGEFDIYRVVEKL